MAVKNFAILISTLERFNLADKKICHIHFKLFFLDIELRCLIEIHTSFTPAAKVESTVYTSQLALWCLFEYV